MKIAIKKEKKIVVVKNFKIDFAGHKLYVGSWVALNVAAGYTTIMRIGKVSNITPKGFSYDIYDRKESKFVGKSTCITTKFVVIGQPTADD
jgi:hypothetical protein